jgi:uncharacterized metal-binding protein
MKTRNLQKKYSLLFVCSGVADVGELTDMAARDMNRKGLAAMSCLASVGAQLPQILFNIGLAERVLVIDGCPQTCASKTLRHAGVENFLHFDLSELGFCKRKAAPTPERVQTVVYRAVEMLNPKASQVAVT